MLPGNVLFHTTGSSQTVSTCLHRHGDSTVGASCNSGSCRALNTLCVLMQVENEDLVFTLETMVEKFGDEIAPYAVSRSAGTSCTPPSYAAAAASVPVVACSSTAKVWQRSSCSSRVSWFDVLLKVHSLLVGTFVDTCVRGWCL